MAELGASAHDAELLLLRDFYTAWVALHRLPGGTPQRDRAKQEAAQELVDCAHALRRMYQGVLEITQEAGHG